MVGPSRSLAAKQPLSTNTSWLFSTTNQPYHDWHVFGQKPQLRLVATCCATAGRRQAFAEAQALAALEDAKARWQFSPTNRPCGFTDHATPGFTMGTDENSWVLVNGEHDSWLALVNFT